MRILGRVVLVLWLPGQVLAAPEPPPPGDYPGAQYIDRTGCVFTKEGAEWLPRLDKAGAPVCGFPPSQPAEATQAPEPAPSAEEVLTTVLAEGLRSGDLAAEAPPQALNPIAPDPAQTELNATLAQQIDADARLRSAMAGRAPDGLCARLGYRPAGEAAPIAGGDVTQGLCSGMKAPDPIPGIVTAAAAPPEAVPVSNRKPAEAHPKTAASAPVQKPAAAETPTARPGSVLSRRPAPTQAAKAPLVEMIPAHARYVQIGTYADEANALAALRRLSAMGYRAAQRSEKVGKASGKAILAGPFADRQALVAALTRLRANGYPRAVAR